jgi:hypothetical protein
MRNLILVVVLLGLALVGCSRISQQGTRATGLDIALAVHPDPPGVGPCHLTINLTDAEGAPIDKAHLQIKGGYDSRWNETSPRRGWGWRRG